MAAGTEILKAPKASHVGAWLLVASALLVTALVLAFALTRSGTAPTTVTKPAAVVTATAENGYDLYRGDAGPVARPCVQFGACGTAFVAPADITPVADSVATGPRTPITVGDKLCGQCS